MFAYIKYLFFSPMLFLNIHLLLSSEITLNTQICLCLSYYKNDGKHYRYCYIIHFEIQYMHYKHRKSDSFSISSLLQTWHFLSFSLTFLNIPVSMWSGKIPILNWEIIERLFLFKQYFTVYTSIISQNAFMKAYFQSYIWFETQYNDFTVKK